MGEVSLYSSSPVFTGLDSITLVHINKIILSCLVESKLIKQEISCTVNLPPRYCERSLCKQTFFSVTSNGNSCHKSKLVKASVMAKKVLNGRYQI